MVELAEFYQVSIPEIIDGERKSESMNQETKDTAVKMAEYSKSESHHHIISALGIALSIFGLFTMISGLGAFPPESSWGSIYSVFGGIVLLAGITLYLKPRAVKKSCLIAAVIGGAALLFGVFSLSDYIAVSQFHQIPRFCYAKEWSSENPDQVVYKTLFFTAVQTNRDTPQARVDIIR